MFKKCTTCPVFLLFANAICSTYCGFSLLCCKLSLRHWTKQFYLRNYGLLCTKNRRILTVSEGLVPANKICYQTAMINYVMDTASLAVANIQVSEASWYLFRWLGRKYSDQLRFCILLSVNKTTKTTNSPKSGLYWLEPHCIVLSNVLWI